VRILIAEDDPTSRRVLQAVLSKWGFDVLETQNGAEAWNVLKKDSTLQIGIFDWMMPEMDGLEAGANDCLTKPFNREELMVRVKVGRRVVEMQSDFTQGIAGLQDALAQSNILTEEGSRDLMKEGSRN
jgi:DNA-binding response OmpR family regulator